MGTHSNTGLSASSVSSDRAFKTRFSLPLRGKVRFIYLVLPTCSYLPVFYLRRGVFESFLAARSQTRYYDVNKSGFFFLIYFL